MEQIRIGSGAAGGMGATTPTAVVELKRSLIPVLWEEQVRSVGISEYNEVALSLAQAFATNDLAQYLLDSDDMATCSDEAKWKLHVDIMKYIVASHCYSGLVTTIGPDYEGVALWMPPGKSGDDWLTTLRSGIWRLHYQLSSEGRQRYFTELMPLLHDTLREVMGDRCGDVYYLVYLGTKPSGRSRGYASKLIQHMAAKADAEGRPMYLESSPPKNNAFYRKFSFERKKDVLLGAGTAKPVRLSIMVREPQKLAKSVPIKLGPVLKMKK